MLAVRYGCGTEWLPYGIRLTVWNRCGSKFGEGYEIAAVRILASDMERLRCGMHSVNGTERFWYRAIATRVSVNCAAMLRNGTNSVIGTEFSQRYGNVRKNNDCGEDPKHVEHKKWPEKFEIEYAATIEK